MADSSGSSIRGLTILRVRGIPMRLHWTLFAMIGYLAWVFSLRFSALSHERGPLALPPLGWGLLVAIGLFVGVALHELGHSLLAIAWGGKVRSITLTFIGGVSEIEEMPEKSLREALVAFAGPLVSFALFFLGWGIERAVSGPPDVTLALGLFARLNLVIGIFNLLPAFPLDGGRVLRSLLLGRLGRVRATQVAAGVSKALALGLAVLGLFGNWLMLVIAFFLWVTADAEVRGERVRLALRNVEVADLIDPELPEAVVTAGTTLDIVAERMIAERRLSMVVVSGANIVGVVPLADVKRVPLAARAATPVEAIAQPLPVVDAHQPVEEALRSMEQQHTALAVATENGQIVGMLSRDAILRAVELGEMVAREGGRRFTWPWPMKEHHP